MNDLVELRWRSIQIRPQSSHLIPSTALPPHCTGLHPMGTRPELAWILSVWREMEQSRKALMSKIKSATFPIAHTSGVSPAGHVLAEKAPRRGLCWGPPDTCTLGQGPHSGQHWHPGPTIELTYTCKVSLSKSGPVHKYQGLHGGTVHMLYLNKDLSILYEGDKSIYCSVLSAPTLVLDPQGMLKLYVFDHICGYPIMSEEERRGPFLK